MSYISAAQAKQIAQKAVDNLKDGTLVPKFAENLTPYAEDSGITQTQPFFNEGTATGNGESRVDTKQVPAYALLQEKRGNMVCVNQLAGENLGGVSGLTITNNSGIYTINGTSSSAGHYLDFVFNCLSGHKYLVIATAKNYPDISDNTNPGIQLYGTNVIYAYVYISNVVRNGQTFLLGTATGSGAAHFRFRTSSNVTYNNTQITPRLVDLTQWFNSNIPAYLLSHPEAFGRYYKGSLAYEPGRLEPATGRYLTSVGRNIWDEEWESGSLDTNTGEKIVNFETIRSKNYISINSNTQYWVQSGGFGVIECFYDVDYNYISYANIYDAAFTTPSNAHYMLFRMATDYGTTYNHDITISEYYTGESGYDKYYPHEVLATIDTGTEQLGAFDYKVPSGLIARTTVGIDLGTLNWVSAAGETSKFYSEDFNIKVSGKAICSRYTQSQKPWYTMGNGSLWVNTSTVNHNVWIRDDDYTDAASFKAAMAGVILYYELAEPTTEQGTPFQENVPIDDFGQLSWSNTDVPQGNQIFYPVGYKAAIDTLINYTGGDITGLAKRGSLADTDPQTLKALVDYVNGKIPAAPTTDGTYDLVCEVTNGQPVYSWVSRA